MQPRKSRKGFWWWSWLLLIITAGCIFAGYKWGEGKWASLPKEYDSKLTIQTYPRGDIAISGDSSESVQTLTGFKESHALRGNRVIAQAADSLDLPAGWAKPIEEVVETLRIGLETTRNSSDNLITLRLRTTNPDQSAKIVTAIAEAGIERIKQLYIEERDAHLEVLDANLEIFRTEAEEDRLNVKRIFNENNIPIDPAPDMDLRALDSTYADIEGLTGALLDWKSSRDKIKVHETSQKSVRQHWERPVADPVIAKPANIPSAPSGPDKGPHLQTGLLYGTIAGPILSLLAMLACWKIFGK